MNKLLVALDGSPRQDGVLAAAIALARKTGAALVLFRSVGIPHEIPAEAFGIAPDAVPALLEERAIRELDELRSAVPADVHCTTRTLVGTPWQSIERVATEEDVGLIVIGSHGYHGADRVLGTTAAKVVNHADRSVLVVRAPERF